MRKLLVPFALLLASMAFGQEKQIDQVVTALMQKKGIPGCSIAVIKDGKIVLAKGYGYADVENEVPATADTVYEIGSVTKQFTAALVMKLVEQGKVKLDEPAKNYILDLPEAWKVVTVRQLLTHISGIPSYTSVPGFEKKFRLSMGIPEFYDFIGKLPFDFPSGDQWRYNNSGFYILGILVEKVTGKSYKENLHATILDPLGMSHTDLGDAYTVVKHRARGYNPDPKNGPTNAEFIDMGWPFAAGAMISTVKDMAKWDAALWPGKLLTDASLQQMWSPVKLNSGKTFDYGFGWMLGKTNGVPYVEHGGDIPGFNAQILRYPSKKLSVIVLCNADPGIATAASHAIAGVVDPQLKVPDAKPIKDEDPKTTEFHKSVLQSFADGTPNKDLFNEAMQKAIFPDIAKQVHQFMKAMGPIQKMDLMQAAEKDGMKIRIYKVVFGTTELNAIFNTDAAGKIAGFQLRPA